MWPTPPAPAMNEHVMTGTHGSPIDHAFPRGNRDERHRRRLTHRESQGLFREQRCRHGDILGERALDAADAPDHSIHVVAGTKAIDTGTDRFNGAGHIEPDNRRQRLLCVRGRTRADLRIERIDAAGADPYEHLTGSHRRHGPIDANERTIGFFNDICAHDDRSTAAEPVGVSPIRTRAVRRPPATPRR